MVGLRSPKLRPVSFSTDTKPLLPTPIDQPNPFELIPTTTRPLDLDGMTVMTDVDMPVASDSNLGMSLDLGPVVESPEEEDEEEELPWGKDPATATWAPMMEEVPTIIPRYMTAAKMYCSRSSGQTGAIHLL
jgi:hypothetical protein